MIIGLVGDYQVDVTAHKAIPVALSRAAQQLSMTVEHEWLNTDELDLNQLQHYAGLWCVPASPYKDDEKVLESINFARLNNLPFLGTCGGYQYAALEFARNALGFTEADNAETTPDATMPVISGLSCKLYDSEDDISLVDNSNIAAIYNKQHITEEYFCGFGVNRDYMNIYQDSEMNFSGFDNEGDPRALEIPANRFFIGTAFQPERSALKNLNHPLIGAFVSAAATTNKPGL